MKNSVAYTGMVATLTMGFGLATTNALLWDFVEANNQNNTPVNVTINEQQTNDTTTIFEVVTPRTGRNNPYTLPECDGTLRIDVIEPGTLGSLFDTMMNNHSKPVFTCNEVVIPEKDPHGNFHY